MHNKFQSAFSIIGLAVAFFCFGICMYFVMGILTMDKYYDNHKRVLRLQQDHHVSGIRNTQFEEIKQLFPEIECYCRFYDRMETAYVAKENVDCQLKTVECDTTLRHIYQPKLIAGSWHAAEHSPNSFLLTERCAKRIFGSAEKAIGQIFIPKGKENPAPGVENGISYQVQAVVENLPYNNSLKPFEFIDAWVMNDNDGHLQREQNYVWIYGNAIMLREGVNKSAFCQRLEKAALSAETKEQINSTGRAAGEVRIVTADPTADKRQLAANNWALILALLIITTPGLLILLSALSSFFHLLLSNIMMRRREYILRRAHGAHTFDLWTMVCTQVVSMLLLVGVFTWITIELLSDYFVFPNNAILDSNEMIRQSCWYLAILLLVGLAVSWLSVARIRKDSLQEAMKTSTGKRPGRHIGRNILMEWQMCVSFIFVTLLAALLLQTNLDIKVMLPWLSNEEKKDIIELPWNIGNTLREATEAELRAVPAIKDVVFCNGYIRNFEFPAWQDIRVVNAQGDTIHASIASCEPEIPGFLNVPLLSGHWFKKADEVLIDQLLAEKNHLQVGDKLNMLSFQENGFALITPEKEFIQYVTIVGIIDNLMQKSSLNMSGNVSMYQRGGIYTNSGKEINGHFAVKAHHGKYDEACKAIQEIQKKLKIKIISTEEDKMPSLYDDLKERNNTFQAFVKIFWVFAIISLLITLHSIYSAVTTDTNARRKEMAIRKINGAKARHIAMRFIRLYPMLMAIAAVIVFPLTYYLIEKYLRFYRETFNLGFVFFLGIFGVMSVFVALTVCVQIWRVSSMNPVKVIKEE